MASGDFLDSLQLLEFTQVSKYRLISQMQTAFCVTDIVIHLQASA